MHTFITKTAITFLCLSILWLPHSLRGEEGASWIPLKSLVNYKGPQKTNVYVEGKFYRSLGESFELCGIPMKFRIRYQSPLFNQVNRYLKEKESNIRVEGDIVYSKFRGWFFKVKNIVPLEEDQKFFERRLALVYRDPAHYYDLAFLADAIAKVCRKTDILSFGEKAMLKAVNLELALLPTKEYKRRLEIAKTLETKYHKPKLAFKVYRQCWNLQHSNDLRMKLVELGGRIYKGKWYLEEELKKMSGMEITKKGEWMVKDKVIFQKFIQSFRQFPKGSFRLFHKKIFPGIDKKKLIHHWKCWPQRVWRKKKGKNTFEMWTLK
ncbi:MAG: hypothetical protein D6785_00290, partial [Planctomycetota bacterium]